MWFSIKMDPFLHDGSRIRFKIDAILQDGSRIRFSIKMNPILKDGSRIRFSIKMNPILKDGSRIRNRIKMDPVKNGMDPNWFTWLFSGIEIWSNFSRFFINSSPALTDSFFNLLNSHLGNILIFLQHWQIPSLTYLTHT